MTTPTLVEIPGSVIADGKSRYDWVPAIADPSAPTVAELTAAGVVPLSCYFTAVTPGTEQASVTDDRVCSRETFEQPGTIQNTFSATYVYDPQNTTPAENLAFTSLKADTKGFVVQRLGLDFEEDYAAGQFVDVLPATCGTQNKLPGERNSTLKIDQKMFMRGRVRRDVVVLA